MMIRANSENLPRVATLLKLSRFLNFNIIMLSMKK